MTSYRYNVLVDGDRVMFETAAILLYLVDRHSALGPPVGVEPRPPPPDVLPVCTISPKSVDRDCCSASGLVCFKVTTATSSPTGTGQGRSTC